MGGGGTTLQKSGAGEAVAGDQVCQRTACCRLTWWVGDATMQHAPPHVHTCALPTSPAQLKFTVGQALPGQQYQWAARARNAAGWGAWTTPPYAFAVPPTTPTILP